MQQTREDSRTTATAPITEYINELKNDWGSFLSVFLEATAPHLSSETFLI